MKSNKPPKKIDKRKLAVRIIAWVLILMTVVTTLYTAIYFIVMGVNAADSEDLSIAVGILYGDDVDVALTASTTNGFTVGAETVEKYKKTFTELWSLPGYKKVTVLCDRNYQKSGSSYKLTSTPNVGAYRLETDASYTTSTALKSAMATVDKALSGTEYYSIPTYINGTYKIRIGSFLTADEASSASATVGGLLTGTKLTIKSPSATGTFAVEHDTSKVLFEYDCGTSSYLALDAINNADGTEAYLTTYNNNLYDGVFVFKRTPKGSSEGITLMTVVPLEEYIMGVIPHEISTSWPLETQKAFAIVARTFAIDQLGKHWNQYGFNVCSTSNCQVYGGVARVNDTVRTAVRSTAGLITTYNGKLASMYYSSSTGNCTADVVNVWGNSVAWLTGIETPWEDYLHHSNSFWTYEVSPTDLCTYLNSRGYTTLKGAIASVTIDKTSSDISTYVCGVTVTDTSGNSVKITRCDKVRNAFYAYAKSANFVVGKGSVEYTEYTRTVPPGAVPKPEVTNNIFNIITGSGNSTFNFGSGVNIATGSGTQQYAPSGNVTVITGNGESTAAVSSTTDSESLIVTKTMKASKSDNFIFVGKGWGHGVGLSQWGLRDLADMGLDYTSMIQAYCPGVSITDYKKVVNF